MIMYENKDFKSKLETRYTLEYIDNQKDMDYVASGYIDKGEPWERYKKRHYDNIDEAMEIYILYLLRSEIYHVKLFEEILIDGETVREAYIEPSSTFAYSLKTSIDKNMYEDTKRANNEAETLEKRLYLMEKWMKEFEPAKKAFDKFVKEVAQTENKLTVYRYYSTLRPVAPGTYPHPQEVKTIVNFDDRTYIDDVDRFAWGYVEYEKELEWSEADAYDLAWSRYTKTEITA